VEEWSKAKRREAVRDEILAVGWTLWSCSSRPSHSSPHLSTPVETPSKHLLRDTHLKHVAGELAASLPIVDSRGALKHLDDSARSRDLKDLPGAGRPIAKGQVDDLSVLGELHVIKDHKRTINSSNCPEI